LLSKLYQEKKRKQIKKELKFLFLSLIFLVLELPLLIKIHVLLFFLIRKERPPLGDFDFGKPGITQTTKFSQNSKYS